MSKFKALRIPLLCLFTGGIGFQWWLADILISQRPTLPTRVFNIPFEAHGGTTYISLLDQREYTGSWALMAVSAVLYGLLYIADPATPKGRPQGQ
jgi:hypothetical protein